MRRLFIESELSDEIIITGADALHLLYAMRAKPGQRIIVAGRDGAVAETEIADCRPQRVILHLLKRLEGSQYESPVELALIQCLPKGDKMDYIVQKAVELGVIRIIPAVSRNCIVRYDAVKKEKRCQKWQKIADEAAKQCGRSIRPEVGAIIDMDDCLKETGGYSACMCYENEGDMSFKRYLKGQSADKYMLIIGPEGGFTAEEAEKCKAGGIISVSLGRRILRTETAAVAALAVMQYEKGDLGA